MTKAVRQHDRRTLFTVGLVDWSLDRPGLRSGFVPDKIVADLDFLCVHFYPKKGEVPKAIETLRGFAVGKPVVTEFGQFITESRAIASGWRTSTGAELRKSKTIGDAILLGWLEFFHREAGKAK